MYVLLYLHHDITGIHENWKAMRHSIELCLLQGRIGTFQKFSALKFQNNRRTNKIKTICPLILDLRVIKKEHGPPFEYCVIPFTQGCFVPSQVQIGPVILGNKISNNYNFFHYYFSLENYVVLHINNLDAHLQRFFQIRIKYIVFAVSIKWVQ